MNILHRPEMLPVHSTREFVGAKSSAWLLLINIIIMGMFAAAECNEQTEICCLRSIKESLQDPLNSLSTWQFNNNYSICNFRGVECWHPDEFSILNLNLRGMGLRGEFPRGIANCSSLTSLDLSRNQLYGSIPSNMSDILRYVTYLDLSFNSFSGEIPSGISNCSFLNVLNLNNNLLTGNIPIELARLQRLKNFSIAGNLLSGPVPSFVSSNFSVESCEDNPGLCGEPLDPCEQSSFRKRDFVNGFLVGWAVFFLLSLLLGLFMPFGKLIGIFKKRVGWTTQKLELLSSRNTTDEKPMQISELEKFVPSMIWAELNKASDCFSHDNVIARGESGTVYKAGLKNGWSLAIKRFHPLHPEQEFLAEIMILGRIKHNSLVPLMGFCYESNERMLIYKFAPIGSLYDCLFPSNGKSLVLMEWPVKVKIAIGVAKGIAWLHHNGVVHRGITSKCILLDENLDPKISEFGRVTQFPNQTNYSDLEQYSWNREFSVPGSYVEDVYGFGVMLLELVTGKEQNTLMDSFGCIDGHLVDVVSHLLNMRLEELGIDRDASHFLRIAGKCVECEPGKWPSMLEVYQMLIGTRESTISWSDSKSNNEIELSE